MGATILRGSVFDRLPQVKRGSVAVAVTSPPYWMLRNYLPKDHPSKHLELGSEPTPQAYVESMVKVFRLVRDTLADHGTVWVNVGDTYATGGGGVDKKQPKHGNLCLIPQRLAIALQADGWIVRSIVVWHKPAPMPSSVTGWSWQRCRVKVAARPVGKTKATALGVLPGRDPAGSTHKATGRLSDPSGLASWRDCPGCKKCSANDGLILRKGSWRPTSSWEPVLMLAKSSTYFCDQEAVKTPPSAATISRDQYTRILDDEDEQFAVRHDHETVCNGANPRDVWTIGHEPLKEKHYAAYPTELVERCLRAGTSSKGYCHECGMPWVRVVEAVDTGKTQKMADGWDTGKGGHGKFHRNGSEKGEAGKPVMANQTVGWRSSCTCPTHEPCPGLVLDPFAGSGRTGIAAQRLGLDFIGVELNDEYASMAERLIHGEMPLFASSVEQIISE